MTDVNRQVFERDATDYDTRELQRPEQMLLGRLRGRWHEMSMLDIGIGTGRTTYTFAPLVRRYVGVDYAPRMIELARERIGEDDRTRLVVADARHLTETVAGPFDLVLFSYNGIDYVGHEDRVQMLAQIRQVIADDGWFFFSSHSAATLPLTAPPLAFKPKRPLMSAFRAVRALRQRRLVRQLNGELDVESLRSRGWGVVRDSGHGFGLRTMYVTAEYQLRELADAGFGDVEVYALDGSRVEASRPGGDPWLHYLARPVSASS